MIDRMVAEMKEKGIDPGGEDDVPGRRRTVQTGRGYHGLPDGNEVSSAGKIGN